MIKDSYMDKIIMNCLTVKGLDSLVAGKKD